MNTLRDALPEYLQLRRSLGFKLKDAGLQLPRFVAFVEQHGSTHITNALALAWACSWAFMASLSMPSESSFLALRSSRTDSWP